MNDQTTLWALVALVYVTFCLWVSITDLLIWYRRQTREWHALIGTCDAVFGRNGYAPIYPPKPERHLRCERP